MVTNNPVASASEYKRFIENIYSFLLGIETNSSTRRTKSDGIFGKGAFGTCMSLYGPHETQSRGGLHSHVNAWGSIPPSLLQKAIEDETIWKKFARVLESQFQCEIDINSAKKHAFCNYLAEEKGFKQEKVPNPVPFSVPDQSRSVTEEDYGSQLSEICRETSLSCHLHKHTFTCAKHRNGNCYCRLAYPQPMEKETSPLQVLYDLDKDGNYKLSKINTRKVKTTYNIDKDAPRETVDEQIQIDKRAIMWALKRSQMIDDSFQKLENLSNGNFDIYKKEVFQYINEFIPEEWSLFLKEELNLMERKQIIQMMGDLKEGIENLNSNVVMYNKLLLASTKCNSASYMLSNEQNAINAMIYLAPYMSKGKHDLGQYLATLQEAVKMCKKYPSVSEDRDTIDRQIIYLMESFINKADCLEEISDTQISAALIGLKSTTTTNKFVWSPIFQIYEYQRGLRDASFENIEDPRFNVALNSRNSEIDYLSDDV